MLIVPTNTRPGPDNWPEILEEAQGFGADIREINEFINRVIRYKQDVVDEWRGPHMTSKGVGDCEDIALLKLALLRDFPARWLVVGHHYNRPHAVAVVQTDTGLWVLDNLSDEPYELRGSPFKPAYGLGMDGNRYLFLETRKRKQ